MHDEIVKDKKFCMPWGGILAGAFIAVGLSFLFGLFAAAIGLAGFHTSAQGTTMAVGGYIGLVIGTIAIMYLAGWVAGYFGHRACCNCNVGAVFGLSAWCVALVIMMLLATPTMNFISNHLYVITHGNTDIARSFNDTATPVVTRQDSMLSEREANELLAKAMFLTFALFFVGAISSAIGGYCGLKCCEKCCSLNCNCNCDKDTKMST